jgi:hypothetical protein
MGHLGLKRLGFSRTMSYPILAKNIEMGGFNVGNCCTHKYVFMYIYIMLNNGAVFSFMFEVLAEQDAACTEHQNHIN